MSLDSLNSNQFGNQQNMLNSGNGDQMHALTGAIQDGNSQVRAMQSHFSADIPGLANQQEQQGGGIQENIDQE